MWVWVIPLVLEDTIPPLFSGNLRVNSLKNQRFYWDLVRMLGFLPRKLSLYRLAFIPKSALQKNPSGDHLTGRGKIGHDSLALLPTSCFFGFLMLTKVLWPSCVPVSLNVRTWICWRPKLNCRYSSIQEILLAVNQNIFTEMHLKRLLEPFTWTVATDIPKSSLKKKY